MQTHQEYLANVISKTKEVNDNNNDIPELEVYIVNLHPSKQKQPQQRNPPERDPLNDHDGVKDRQNDIIFGDRTSHYDEKQAHLIGDLQDFVARLRRLSTDAISKLTEGQDLNKELEEILSTPITPSMNSKSQQGTYNDLVERYYKLTKVVRIERIKYEDSIYGKAGDFTYETIQQLIKEGMEDATQASLT